MSSPLRDPKQLTEWLELDYFNRPSPFRRLRRVITRATFFVALAAVTCWTFLPHQQAVYQAGPVSTAHTLFNNDCGRCHAGSFETLHRFVAHNPSIHSVTDETCSGCHAGPKHHPDKVSHDTACVTCHREHHGQDALARVADVDCLTCHRDLRQRGSKPGSTTLYDNVPGFDGHPDFARRWAGAPEGPGTIRFNHQVHLNPDGVVVRDGEPLEVRPGEKPRRERLTCGNCHRPDEAGRSMKPVRFEQHCERCHPLAVQVTTALQTPQARQARQEFAAVWAPHREPVTVRAALRQRLTDFILQDNHKPFLGAGESEEPPRPLPGWPGPRPVSKEQFEWVNRQLGQIEDVLFGKDGGCRYCHREENAGNREDGLPRYLPSRINTRDFPVIGASARWFPHSRFSHAAHRMLDCAGCHHGVAQSTKTGEVHLPAVADCRACHSQRAGKARGDCVECHTYHPREE
jgi:hypothetical protein